MSMYYILVTLHYLNGYTFTFRIDIHFVIKIADFGLSEDVYAKNYFRQSGSDTSVKLPVKWMAPESLSDGIFSEKSDVVRLSILIILDCIPYIAFRFIPLCMCKPL